MLKLAPINAPRLADCSRSPTFSRKQAYVTGIVTVELAVENAITSHPDVIEAAVVAAPDPKWGEIPIAYVTRRDGSALQGQQLIEYVKTRIARFKAPKMVVFDSLPKTSTGKVQKNQLRARAATDYPQSS